MCVSMMPASAPMTAKNKAAFAFVKTVWKNVTVNVITRVISGNPACSAHATLTLVNACVTKPADLNLLPKTEHVFATTDSYSIMPVFLWPVNRPVAPTETAHVTSQPPAAKNIDAVPVAPQPAPVAPMAVVLMSVNVLSVPFNRLHTTINLTTDVGMKIYPVFSGQQVPDIIA